MATQSKSAKKKKKLWIHIIAPKEFNNKEIGETHVYDPAKAVGKRVSCNLSFLINDFKKQFVNINFVVNDVKENKAVTEIIGYEFTPSYLKRLSKISKLKAEQTINLRTKDDVGMIVKTVISLKSKKPNKILTVLRSKVEDIISKEIKSKSYSELVDEIIFFKLQKMIHSELKKIVPVSNFVIRSFKKVK